MIKGIYTFGFSGQWKFAAPALYFLLCWECFSMEGYASRAFCWTPLRRMGSIGYSYFIHGLVLNSILLALPTFSPPPGMTFGYLRSDFPHFFVTVRVSTLFFLWVEKPFSLTTTS